jgi:hypothetical protein
MTVSGRLKVSYFLTVTPSASGSPGSEYHLQLELLRCLCIVFSFWKIPHIYIKATFCLIIYAGHFVGSRILLYLMMVDEQHEWTRGSKRHSNSLHRCNLS